MIDFHTESKKKNKGSTVYRVQMYIRKSNYKLYDMFIYFF